VRGCVVVGGVTGSGGRVLGAMVTPAHMGEPASQCW